ncbi:MAG: hypothetical protein WCH52_00560 [Bacteroidota bacterium]
MKKIFIASITIIALMLNSCDPAATFDKPQPDKQKPLTSFPKRTQGNYLSKDESSILTISDKLLTRHFDYEYKEHKDSIIQFYKLNGDTIISKRDGVKEKVIVVGDTVIRHANLTDTLFYISEDNLLNKFKGYYFLNKHLSNNTWEVNKLSLQNGVLTYGIISEGDDIKRLNEITESSADTTSKHFDLTRKQFKKFIKQGGFSEEEKFDRIR